MRVSFDLFLVTCRADRCFRPAEEEAHMEFRNRTQMPDLVNRLMEETEHADDGRLFLPHLKEIADGAMDDRLIEIEALIDGTDVVGYYEILNQEYLTDNPGYSPWLSGTYIFEKYRRQKLSPLLIERACERAGEAGFSDIFAATVLIRYLEQFGFEEIGLAIDEAGNPCKLYRRMIHTPRQLNG